MLPAPAPLVACSGTVGGIAGGPLAGGLGLATEGHGGGDGHGGGGEVGTGGGGGDSEGHCPDSTAAVPKCRAFGNWRGETSREQANHLTVGGMRRPATALGKVPGLEATGRKVRAVIEAVLDEHPALLQLVEPGKGEGVWSHCSEIMEESLTAKICLALKAASSARGPRSRWRAGIVEGFIRDSGDPEVHLPSWLRDGAPTGVAKSIPACGIFPQAGTEATAEDVSKIYAHSGGHVNYASVRDHAGAVRKELRRLEGLGYIRRYASWAQLTAAHGPVVVSKLAALSKTKQDGTVKLRLIVDMRRSRLNAHVRLEERIVLPRLSDAVHDAMAMLQQSDSAVDMLAVDFADAFQTMGVHAEELRNQVVAGFDGEYFVLESVAFGGAGSPLLWGRAAAFLGRSGQSLFSPSELRTEVYVDDPWVVAAGPLAHRTRCMCILLLWWLALGLNISWGKLQRGAQVTWIGAEIAIVDEATVRVSLPPRFVSALRAEVCSALGEAEGAAVPLALVQAMAGRASWAAGVVPCLGSMLDHIWAAIADVRKQPAAATATALAPPRRRDSSLWVPRRRIRHACEWLLAVLDGRQGALEQLYRAPHYFGEGSFVMTVDASPWGLGGYLSFRGRAIGWFADRIWPEDVARLRIEIGSAVSQAVVEALALLVAARMWAPLWRGQRLRVCARSDSEAALGAISKQRSQSRSIAIIIRELALDVASGTYDIQLLEHIPGCMNCWADALSRLWRPASGAEVPRMLSYATQCTPARRGPVWWRLHPGSRSGGDLDSGPNHCSSSSSE